MFRANPVDFGRGVLSVSGGNMNLRVRLSGSGIVAVFLGSAEDALRAEKKGKSAVIRPESEKVAYPDGLSESVSVFTIPVKKIGEEFEISILGKKGIWYSHSACVSDPVGGSVPVRISGGTGRAFVENPAAVVLRGAVPFLRVAYSSPNYESAKSGGKTYKNENPSGNSVFLIPIAEYPSPLEFSAVTTAMGTPHEIEYRIEF